MNKLGHDTRELRNIKGWTQEDLAKEMSRLLNMPVHRSAISQWENGQRSPHNKKLDCLLLLIEENRVTNYNAHGQLSASMPLRRVPIVNINKINSVPLKNTIESGELFIGGYIIGKEEYLIIEISGGIMNDDHTVSLGKRALLTRQKHVNKGDLAAVFIRKIKKAVVARAYESPDGLAFIEDKGIDARIWRNREVIVFGKVLYYINKV